MLFGQNGRWNQHGDLLPVFDHLECRAHGELCLTIPNVAAYESVHGSGREKVVAYLRSDQQLVFRFLILESGFKFALPLGVRWICRATFLTACRLDAQKRLREVRDGLADLLISETVGGIMDAGYNSYVFFNRGSGWDIGKPDYAFETPEVLGAGQLIDIDGDGKLELLRIGVPINILELIEIFLTEEIDANLAVYRLDRPASVPATPMGGDPWFEVKLGVALDFDTSRPAGFIPTVEHDFNGDGFRDYISSTDGTKLEIFVGDPKKGYKSRSARQKIATEGQIRPGDLNGDGLTDLVLFNTRRDNQPVMLLTNLGVLPGTVVTPGLEKAEVESD